DYRRHFHQSSGGRDARPAGTASGRQAGGGGHDHRHLPRHLSETAWRRAAHQPRRGPDHRGAGAAGVRPKRRRKSAAPVCLPGEKRRVPGGYRSGRGAVRRLSGPAARPGCPGLRRPADRRTEAGCHRPAVLPPCAGGRVSGYQRYPIPAGPVLEPERGAVRHRRPGPVHLRLPGRRLPVLPAASRGASWCKGNSPNRKLPLCSG
ncbi:Secreted effector protein PipB, partial [Dysosmobacter welbionis]